MNLDEAVNELEDGTSVYVNDYEVGPADNFIGGSGGYISEVLGNVSYISARTVLLETISVLEEEGVKAKISL